MPELTLRHLLEEMVARGASDLHISAGARPALRIKGSMTLTELEELTPEKCCALAYSVLSDDQRKTFEATKELDFSFGVKGLSRFRANVFMQRGVTTMSIRRIPYDILLPGQLGLPEVVRTLTFRRKGLVLVTGPSGCGKSSTLASMLDEINTAREGHILTIEKPIEYIHHHKQCLVSQREIGADTASFPVALKHALHEDTDVVLISEMRDPETVAAALTVVETGHLVLAAMDTNSVYETVTCIVDMFPEAQQRQITTRLASSLEGVITQQLIPHSSGTGRILAAEILVCTPAIKAVMREGKFHQIYSLMLAGQKYGDQTMNQALCAMVCAKHLDSDVALDRSYDRMELEGMLQKLTHTVA